MGKHNCAIIGCTNSSNRLIKWRNSSCDIHVGRNRTDCGCEPPFRLFCFPGPIISPEKRESWIRSLNRETKCRKPWKPCSSDRICSDHFVDGIPTESNPDPTLKLGFEALPRPMPRRALLKVPIEKKQHSVDQSATALSSTTVLAAEENQNENNEDVSARSRLPLHVPPDHCYAMSEIQTLCE